MYLVMGICDSRKSTQGDFISSDQAEKEAKIMQTLEREEDIGQNVMDL
jgi:hypothetical protein